MSLDYKLRPARYKGAQHHRLGMKRCREQFCTSYGVLAGFCKRHAHLAPPPPAPPAPAPEQPKPIIRAHDWQRGRDIEFDVVWP